MDDPNAPTLDRTAEITRGILRLVAEMGYHPLTELTVHTGRRADVVGIDKAGKVVIVEVKSSLQDFRADSKWPDYLPHCDFFYFGVGADFDLDLLPDAAGILVADRYGGEVLRAAREAPMHASTRRSLLLRFARTAAGRLWQLQSAPDL